MRPLLANFKFSSVDPAVCVNAGSWARRWCVLSGPASCFLAQWLPIQIGVLNIAGAAVIPFITDGTQAVLIDANEVLLLRFS